MTILSDETVRINKMDFVLDTAGDVHLLVKSELNEKDKRPLVLDKVAKNEAILRLFEEKKEEIDTQERYEEAIQNKLNNLKMESLFDEFFEQIRWTGSLVIKKEKKQLFRFDQLNRETGKLNSSLGTVDIDKEMKKSLLQPDIEKECSLPNPDVNRRKLLMQRKRERETTKGPKWFNMPAPELTEEMKNDLQILKMRSVMNPKHFYKKNDMEVLPKYFQVGRIMDSPLDHVKERVTRKQRKRTMVDELLADADFQKHNKKKYKEIIGEKRKSEYRTFMKDKRQKNKSAIRENKSRNKKTKN